MNGSCIT